jgi:mannose/cellobiose epimerase-like protein (N-acyl-D-glucosamine 2-epimerase family)/mannose-1-phosphate guanylyltransferase
LATDGGKLVVIGGLAHHDIILKQLEEVGLEAEILLEPQPRGSAAAMAAAAAWVVRSDPEGIVAFVASDHYIPDDTAFRQSVIQAAESAREGKIVTLGVKPSEPSAAYGYIRPANPGLSPVETFREKPDNRTAAAYIKAGCLWNSGNFIVAANVLLSELKVYAPAVEAAASASLPISVSSIQTLGDVFIDAPKISIDYALMEKTRLAWVLPVDFSWSDLGAWDAVCASGEGSLGAHIFEDADHCIARAPDGVLVAALGVTNLAIIVEPDAVLVCALDRSQEVKRVVERIRSASPSHLDFQREEKESLEAGSHRFADWMRKRALPIWATLGAGRDGLFAESLTLAGRPVSKFRRARVQARQIYVFAQAGLLGWGGPWQTLVDQGVRALDAYYLKADGSFRTMLGEQGTPFDDTTMVYDQAFVILALSAAVSSGSGSAKLESRAAALRDFLTATAMPNGAMPEKGTHPFQSNAHMHLLEASLAWEEISSDPGWREFSDLLVALAMQVFIDAEGGFLREFFNEDWRPASGEDGRLVEPGHQFEWAWLLTRYAQQRNDSSALVSAKRLHEIGMKGVESRSGVACDSLNDDLGIRSSRARLWPQTEWIKSSLILAEFSLEGERKAYLEHAAQAQRALWLYLTADGLWRDKRLDNDKFVDEPAPASSLYHIMTAYKQLTIANQPFRVGSQNSLLLS